MQNEYATIQEIIPTDSKSKFPFFPSKAFIRNCASNRHIMINRKRYCEPIRFNIRSKRHNSRKWQIEIDFYSTSCFQVSSYRIGIAWNHFNNKTNPAYPFSVWTSRISGGCNPFPLPCRHFESSVLLPCPLIQTVHRINFCAEPSHRHQLTTLHSPNTYPRSFSCRAAFSVSPNGFPSRSLFVFVPNKCQNCYKVMRYANYQLFFHFLTSSLFCRSFCCKRW